MVSDYQIGALSGLFGAPAKDGGSDNEDIFTTAKKQKEAPAQPEPVLPSPKKVWKQSKPRTDKVEADSQKSPKPSQKDGKKGKKGKKEPKAPEKTLEQAELDGDDSGDESATTQKFTQPSFKAQVRQEDGKKRQKDEEKDARTVFVGNLSTKAKEKHVRKLFADIGKVETVRFRGAARPDMKTTKRVAVITGKIHENRSNILAYVRLSSVEEAKKCAAKLNGEKFMDHILRVDMSEPDTKHDSKKAVFVGNLDFSTEENALHEHFSGCGTIVDVRLVRDPSTGMGKGFGYVNFDSEESVQLALRLKDSDLNGRAIRVERCVKKTKVAVPLDDKKRAQLKKAKGVNKKEALKPKKVTKKAFREMKDTEYQGTKSSKDGKKKAYKKKTKEDLRKDALSKLLMGGNSGKKKGPKPVKRLQQPKKGLKSKK